MGKVNGRVTWFSFSSTHTVSTGIHAMAYFLEVVLQIEPPLLTMVRRPIPPQSFHPDFPPDFA